MDQRVAMPAQVDKVMGHLFQVFRLRFGHPKGRQAMNEEEAGDVSSTRCPAQSDLLTRASSALRCRLSFPPRNSLHCTRSTRTMRSSRCVGRDHPLVGADGQFVMTRLNNGPDSGGYIIQALREAWAADDYHAALAALRMAVGRRLVATRAKLTAVPIPQRSRT